MPASAVWRRRSRSNGQAELLRENLRQMALVTARLEERDLGSAVARDPEPTARPSAAGRLHLRGRRAVRVAAPGVPRAAAGLRASPPRSCS